MRARKPIAPDKRLARQAGMCCSDKLFQAFLYEHDMLPEKPDDPKQAEDAATLAVRLICGVESRADILPGTPAADQWDQLMSKFIAWKIAA